MWEKQGSAQVQQIAMDASDSAMYAAEPAALLVDLTIVGLPRFLAD
jgi:hypothetical protein